MNTAVDITNFMNWWVQQVVRIFTYTFNTLDNIQFAGTSILRVCVFIVIIGALTRVVLTIPGQAINTINKVERNTRKERKTNDNKSK